MKISKVLFLSLFTLFGTFAFVSPASATDWHDRRDAEIRRDYRDAWRHRQALERERRYRAWNRYDRFRHDRSRYRYDWGNRYNRNRWDYRYRH
ncbi:MAG TPA: hypothetical protein VFU31_06405 [Candidatus Binatia bacterium]|nr:hypothetical protein [Candidatus Binatia bacterium]